MKPLPAFILMLALADGCATAPPVLPPMPLVVPVKKQAVRSNIIVPPAKTNILLSWNYPDGTNRLTAVYFSPGLDFGWTLLTNVWTTNFMDAIGSPEPTALGFYRVANAGDAVELAWNPSVSTNVAGYKIYYGGASGNYTNTLSVGAVTNAIVSGLVAGDTFYFAATAVDARGLESRFSNEAVWTAPTNAPTPRNFQLLLR
jgi:hypothetical protein